MRPGLEVGEGEQSLDVIDNHHGELQSILRAKIDPLPVQNLIDRFVEIGRIDEADEVRHLVEAIRRVKGVETIELLRRRRGRLLTSPVARDLDRVVGEQGAKASPEPRPSPAVPTAGVDG